MSGNRFLDWFFRLLFPLALVGVIVYSLMAQPPYISSPEVKTGFARFGSLPGYLEYLDPKDEPWPRDLPPLLKNALVKSFGPTRPRVESFYYFGTAKRKLWGTAAPVGFESLLKPGFGFSRQMGISIFNLHIIMWQTGMLNDKPWSRKNGEPGPADPEAAKAAYLLEQAVWLLPLVGSGLNFVEAGPGRIRAQVMPGRDLTLEFSGPDLVRVSLGEYEIRVEKRISFGDFVLPSLWTGRWGQAGLSELEVQGVILNPPFAEEALNPAAKQPQT